MIEFGVSGLGVAGWNDDIGVISIFEHLISWWSCGKVRRRATIITCKAEQQWNIPTFNNVGCVRLCKCRGSTPGWLRAPSCYVTFKQFNAFEGLVLSDLGLIRLPNIRFWSLWNHWKFDSICARDYVSFLTKTLYKLWQYLVLSILTFATWQL